MLAQDAKKLTNLSKLTPLFNTIKTQAENGQSCLVLFDENLDCKTTNILIDKGYKVDRLDGKTIISWE